MADPQTVIRKPLLDLATFTDRAFVTIDGKPFHLKNGNEMSLTQYFALGTQGEQLAEMSGRLGTLDTKEQHAFSHLLDTICRSVLIAPDDVQARLGDVQRIQIATAFMQLLPPSLRALTRATAPGTGTTPIGARSSRGSAASIRAKRQKHG